MSSTDRTDTLVRGFDSIGKLGSAIAAVSAGEPLDAVRLEAELVAVEDQVRALAFELEPELAAKGRLHTFRRLRRLELLLAMGRVAVSIHATNGDAAAFLRRCRDAIAATNAGQAFIDPGTHQEGDDG